jgi:two-component system OmpR family response regulator
MEPTVCILVVDDQPDLLENLGLALEAAGYQVLTAGDGVEALGLLQSQTVHLILADIAMPRLNGYQLYERVRQNPNWVTIPFLFLTARTLDSDIRYGKELGADDYLPKPIQPEDLLAVVRGKLKRAQQLAGLTASLPPAGAPHSPLIVGRLRIDPGQYAAWLDGQALELSAREFTLLEYLAHRLNQVVSVQELIRVTHGLDTDPLESGTLLRPLVRSLRRKLGYSVGDMGCIENVRGVGYRLVVLAA